MQVNIIFTGGENLEEKLYDMIKKGMDNQQESIKYLSDVVNKITDSQEQTMLLLDETNRRTQEHANKESENWRKATIGCVLIICLMFLGMIAIYFITPFESSSTSISESVAISESNSYSEDGSDYNQSSELIESDGD